MRRTRLNLERLERRVLLNGTPIQGYEEFTDADGDGLGITARGIGDTLVYDANGGPFDPGDELGDIDTDGNSIVITNYGGGNSTTELNGLVYAEKGSVNYIVFNGGDVRSEGEGMDVNGNLNSVKVTGDLHGAMDIKADGLGSVIVGNADELNVDVDGTLGLVYSGGDLSGVYEAGEIGRIMANGDLSNVSVDGNTGLLYSAGRMDNVSADNVGRAISRGKISNLTLGSADVLYGLGGADGINGPSGDANLGRVVIRGDSYGILASGSVCDLGNAEDSDLGFGRVIIRGDLTNSKTEGKASLFYVAGDINNGDVDSVGRAIVGGNADGLVINDGDIYICNGETSNSEFGGEFRYLVFGGTNDVDFDRAGTVLAKGNSNDLKGNRADTLKMYGSTQGLDVKDGDRFIGLGDNSNLTYGSGDSNIDLVYGNNFTGSLIYGNRISRFIANNVSDTNVVAKDSLDSVTVKRSATNSDIIAGLTLQDRGMGPGNRWYEPDGEGVSINYVNIRNPDGVGVYAGVMPVEGWGTFGKSDIGRVFVLGNPSDVKVMSDNGSFWLLDEINRNYGEVSETNPYQTSEINALVVEPSE